MTDPYFLVVGCDDELAPLPRLMDLETLGEIDLVACRVCGANAEIERILRSHGVQPRVVFRAEDNRLLQGLAAEGIGAAIMPYLAIDHSRRRHRARRSQRADSLAENRPSWHADRYRTPAAEAFIELARQVGRELAGQIATEHAKYSLRALTRSTPMSEAERTR